MCLLTYMLFYIITCLWPVIIMAAAALASDVARSWATMILTMMYKMPGPSQYKDAIRIKIFTMKIRWSDDHFIYRMRILIPGKMFFLYWHCDQAGDIPPSMKPHSLVVEDHVTSLWEGGPWPIHDTTMYMLYLLCFIVEYIISGEALNFVCQSTICLIFHFDGLVQDCSNSSVLAMELLQSYTKP